MTPARQLITIGLATAGLTACALPGVLPPFNATARAMEAPAPAPDAVALLPMPGPAHNAARIATEHDSATDQTRVSLTTHPGAYFLWVQRPRVTFFYVYGGSVPDHAPNAVFLTFRAHEPQVPSTNRLTLICDDIEQSQSSTPTFAFEQGPMISSRAFTYELPLQTFAGFVSCARSALRVGDISVAFDTDQLNALRAFAAGMRVDAHRP